MSALSREADDLAIFVSNGVFRIADRISLWLEGHGAR